MNVISLKRVLAWPLRPLSVFTHIDQRPKIFMLTKLVSEFSDTRHWQSIIIGKRT